MKFKTLKKLIAGFFVATVLLSHSFFGLNYLTQPKPAQAFLGIGDVTFSFSTEVGNFYDIVKDIGLAASKRIAKSYIDKYLGDFIDKLLDKYKIRNYLYYAQLLDMYYLNQYIADKIEDPDLRSIYLTLASNVKINIYTTSEVEKRKLTENLKKEKKLLAEQHQKQGGITTEQFRNPDPSLTSYEKFGMARTYSTFHPDFTEETLRAQFAQSQAEAQSASAKELDSSNGLKNERTTQEKVVNGIRVVQTAISNPASFAENMARSAVDKIFDNGADANNIWSVVGDLLGNFIFRKLDVEKTGDGSTINEYPLGDTITPVPSAGERIDLDADGFPDGEDVDGDGALDSLEDICFHGGVPGVGNGCYKSTNVSSSAFFTPLCQALDKAVSALNNYSDFMERNSDLLKPNGADFKNDADADIWGRRAQTANSDVDNLLRVIDQYRNPNLDRMEIVVGRFSSYMNKSIQSLFKDRDMDLGGWFSNGDGGLDALISSVREIIAYLEESKAAIGKCEDPDLEAVGAVEPPDISYPGTCDVPSNARGNDAGAPTTAPNIGDVVFREAPQVAGWGETGSLTSVSADSESITLNYNKANTWPGVDIGNGAIAVANPWILVWRGGAWNATTFSWMRPNQLSKDVAEVGCGGPAGSPTLGDFTPVAGETYGFMVSMIARDASFSAQQAQLNGGVQERTNILMYRWTENGTPPPGGGSNHVCSDKGNGVANYANTLQSGINHINNTNPNDIASKLNNATNSATYLTLVASYLESIGFKSTVNVFNGNGNPNKGHLIAVWRQGDTTLERYDAIIGMEAGVTPLRDAATAGTFTGDIPLICLY